MPGFGAQQPGNSVILEIPLLAQRSDYFSGATTNRDFLFRLPAQVHFKSGSEALFTLLSEPALLSLVAEVHLAINGQTVVTHSLNGKNPSKPNDLPLKLKSQIPSAALQAGLNRVSLRFIHRNTALANQDVLGRSQWTLPLGGSSLSIACQRAELFPELARFPESLAEEKIIRNPSLGIWKTAEISRKEPQSGRNDAQAAARISTTVTLLHPSTPGDAHLRTLAIVAARFGQLGYMDDSDFRLAALDTWKTELPASSGVMIASKSELDTAALPATISARLDSLKSGEGLLAEWVTGNYPDQHRWVLVSGADESGLEKAALTLGCAAALLEVPPNPAVIAGEPQPAIPPVAQAPRPRWKLASLSPFKASETAPQPPAGAGLGSVNPVLVSDKFLRKTAFLLPRSASGNELKLFFDLALFIGSQLPDSPLLWPQACAFSKTSPAPFERLNGRSVLLISPVTEWKYAVPPTTTLPLEVPDSSSVVNVQGRVYELSSFEPSLALVHLLPSPWSPNDALIAAGGWQTSPPDTVKAIFREAAPTGRLFGNLGAMDALGRTVVCNTRQPMLESFAQLLKRHLPKGLSVEQTAEQLIDFEQDAVYSARANRILSWVTGTCLFLVVAARLLLTWERESKRRKIMRSEIPAGSL